jgi:hypothetical protein
MTVMSRQALFEAAWDRPLTELADELGITSTGLKKICDRHDIPTPGRGYWAQVRAGKSSPGAQQGRPTASVSNGPESHETRLECPRRRAKAAPDDLVLADKDPAAGDDQRPTKHGRVLE